MAISGLKVGVLLWRAHHLPVLHQGAAVEKQSAESCSLGSQNRAGVCSGVAVPWEHQCCWKPCSNPSTP